MKLFSLGETYLHRIGRTGRFGKHGLAINLVDGPKSMAVMKEIERHFGKDIIKLDAEVRNSNKHIEHHNDLECFQDVDEIEKLTKD